MVDLVNCHTAQGIYTPVGCDSHDKRDGRNTDIKNYSFHVLAFRRTNDEAVVLIRLDVS